jgi:hypothetical protein
LIKIVIIPFTLSALVIVIPTAIINHHFDKHGAYSITGNGGVNIALTWCQPRRITYTLENGENFWFSPPIFQSKDPSTDIITDVAFYEQGYYINMGINCLIEHPERIITNIEHVINIFHSKFYPNFHPFSLHDELITLWKILTVPLLLGLLYFPIKYQKLRGEWLISILLLITLFIAVYAANPGEERYLVPYFFVILILGIAGLASGVNRPIKPDAKTVDRTNKGV